MDRPLLNHTALSYDAINKGPVASKKQNRAREQGSNEDVFVGARAKKPFTTLSALGIGYSTTNSPSGILLSLGAILPMGGSPLLFWGFILMAAVGLCTAITLAELCSPMPHPGGQYIWVNRLAPTHYRRFLSYLTAMLSWIAAMIAGAAGTLSVSLGIFSIVEVFSPGLRYKRVMTFIVYQVINIMALFGACFKHTLPKISKFLLCLSCATVGSIFILLFAMSNRHADTKDMFQTIVNHSGWPDSLAFLIGLSGINWAFSCLDAITHLAEEIPSPATNLPRALLWTVVVSFGSGTLLILSIIANLPNTARPVNYSMFEIVYSITNNIAVSTGLLVAILLTTFGSMWSALTWQSRIAWTISCESGLPFYQYLRRMAPAPFHTPVWSLIGSAMGIATLGYLYLISEVAFSSLISTAVLLQYMNYSIPVALVLYQGRNNFCHGPFWYPRIGLVANIVMLTWSIIALIFYCFPHYLPIYADQMNYASGILVLIIVFIITFWLFHAKEKYEVNEILEY